MKFQDDSNSMDDVLGQATKQLRETPAMEMPTEAVERAEGIATAHVAARSWLYMGSLAACSAVVVIVAIIAVMMHAAMQKERQQFDAALNKSEQNQQEFEKQIGQLTREREQLILKVVAADRDRGGTLIQKIAKHPHINPQGVMVRRSQGHILSVASDDIVYIDLGQGEQIVPGMTFEVYNKRGGVPAMEDGMADDALPVGEASLEVQEILAKSSQCRVTKLEAGQHITAGDVIANLVYDRNTKFNFVVWGKFHLNPNTPDATRADADIIKGLIVKWGGKIQDHVDVDTDFVVMGEEPKVRDLPAGDTDAFDKAQHDTEVAAQQAYSDVVDEAKDYSKTLMNQNQFLYYTGYYPLAAR